MALVMGLSGCAAFSKISDIIFGQSRERATLTPLYSYRADLEMWNFDGVGEVQMQDKLDIPVISQIHLDRVEVETCARNEVCQNGKPCNSNFEGILNFWGNPGKTMIYHYTPSAIEKASACPIYFRVFDKAVLAAWGYLTFRTNETLSAHVTCNGQEFLSPGHSVCQTKKGLIQTIAFEVPIDDFEIDPYCGMTRIDAQHFEFRPQFGLCTATFYSGGRWHNLEIISYLETLVRGT